MSQYEMSAFDCMQNPQAILGKSLHDKNIEEFRKALDMEADPSRIDNTTNKSIFETALETPGCAAFVEACIKRGCKCDYINRLVNMGPINFAVNSQDPKILKQLLKCEGVPVNNEYVYLTPLNTLAKSMNSKNFDTVFECMKVLIEYGADINIPDRREMTPILYVLNNKDLSKDQKRMIAQYLLKTPIIDLDTFRDGEAREKMSRYFPDITLPNPSDSTPTFESLRTLIRSGSEERFLQDFTKYMLDISDSKQNQQNLVQENNIILLIEAIKQGYNEAVRVIIESGVNVNLSYEQNTAIEIACIYGNWQALEQLITHENLKLKSENLLITIIKKLGEPTIKSYCDYNRCFSILLESNVIDVNETDRFKSSALHYAVKYKNEDAIRKLLDCGAYIGTKSKFDDLPISEMNPQFLEEYLDSCIITSSSSKPGDDDFEITFDYKNLIPSTASSKPLVTRFVQEEMQPIEHIAKSKEMRHLLKHPIIMSFLFLKWHRLSIIFYINFILYALFCFSLVTYIMLDFNNVENETLLYLFKIFSFLGLLYMIVREAIQCLISPQIFLKSVVNYLEIILIVLAIVMLCNPNYQKETQRVLAVCTILLASVELCLLIGSLPILSLSTHMLMLQTVTNTFLKCFTLYSIFIITFSLCFFVLFGHQQPNPSTGQDKSNDNDEGEFNKFGNPFTAIIKTIVMLTGEFDAGDIDFNSLTSYLVFLLFVFFMSIVLFNLLNGLAVSDTQAIKSQAELNGCIVRTKLLASYEKLLTGRNHITGFFVNLPPFRSISNNLISLYPNYIPKKCIKIKPNDGNKILIPNSNPKETSQPLVKRNGETRQSLGEDDVEKSLLPENVANLSCGPRCIEGRCARMDVRTVKNALRVIDKKKREKLELQKSERGINRIENIEKKIDEINMLLKLILDNKKH